MSYLKSIKLYFFAILKLTFLKFKFFYYKTSYYNKKLVTFNPTRIFYKPSAFLISPLISSEKEIYKVENINLEKIWEENILNNFEFENLHSFLWLTKMDRKNGKIITQSIIDSWIQKYFNFEFKSWNILITSKRIIAWLSNTDIILDKTDDIYKNKIFLSLVKQTNFLSKNINNLPFNSSRIICSSSIILFGLVFKEDNLNLKFGIKELEKVVLNYFNKSGFPKSRNPEEVFISIKYLILIREWLREAHEPIPEFLTRIIFKCGECYNFLSNTQKKFPLFNGSTEISHADYDLFLKRFKYNFKSTNNEIGGLFKIKKNKFELFFDVGNPPSNKFCNNYQAGCLSFELISKGEKMICNTGYSKYLDSKLSLLSCSTAAHSTLCLNDTSSSLFQKNKIIREIYGNSLVKKHKILEKSFDENEESYNIFGSHNGYEKKYGCILKRTLKIPKKENKVYGIDELYKSRKNSNTLYYSIRFHIYPGIKIVKTQGEYSVLISLQNGEGWLLKCIENKIQIEKNIFLARKKIFNNECICINGKFNESKICINWEIEKVK